jgi:hypothetical protein
VVDELVCVDLLEALQREGRASTVAQQSLLTGASRASKAHRSDHAQPSGAARRARKAIKPESLSKSGGLLNDGPRSRMLGKPLVRF